MAMTEALPRQLRLGEKVVKEVVRGHVRNEQFLAVRSEKSRSGSCGARLSQKEIEVKKVLNPGQSLPRYTGLTIVTDTPHVRNTWGKQTRHPLSAENGNIIGVFTDKVFDKTVEPVTIMEGDPIFSPKSI